MASAYEEEAAQRIRTLAQASNWRLADDVAEAENERQGTKEDPPVLVALERTIGLMVTATGGEEVLHAMVSSPTDSERGTEMLVLTRSFILRAGLKGHADDASVVMVLPRRRLQKLAITSRYEDRNPRDPDRHPESVAIEATYEGGERIHYEEGQEAQFPSRQLLNLLTRDLRS